MEPAVLSNDARLAQGLQLTQIGEPSKNMAEEGIEKAAGLIMGENTNPQNGGAPTRE